LSPILVRPVREQLEHDRIIRLLHAKFRRKFEAVMNPGVEQNMPVTNGPTPLFPDIVLSSQDRGHRLQAIVEVETGESVNHLEALAQWAHFGRVRAAFHLYVPASMVDVARRLAEDNEIHVAEIWSYHVVGDEPRFTLVHRNREAISAQARVRPVLKPAAKPEPAPKPVVVKPVAKPAAPSRKPAPKAKPKPKPKAASKPKKTVKKKKK
jgi:hypothetical protein